ncbi:hypothetical protein [Coxiella burnetii]|uniref:Uncharacterized protein n=2 Tax=Coxiella burnetii TaxID=777 RepID=Q83F45_COXBU|nr:hypothetical protein [Coxiella burnetii]NP_819156.1 hypothetical protein CBU_0106 [Coxiella burnetii RSA 493]AAO89670.1 hypothetical protein CBU_0106 [Coxiella burnetii RSA 493]ACI23222.1 hypothetical protein CBUD_2001b [Coxiella burnetii Dugway 5J108-111]ACJ19155.1 hypothetical protein CbuG_1907 [Coxiella burnetii CbuG_Q212]ACJ21055.1 hypothetical protein CbuK_1946 [Coxiella burnetii CbuK_Q154]AML47935.1 hypothetical protein AUR58_01150 [Coxiella burnetii]
MPIGSGEIESAHRSIEPMRNGIIIGKKERQHKNLGF